MAEKMHHMTERELAQIIWGYATVAQDRAYANMDRLLKKHAPSLHTQQSRPEDDYPTDHPSESWHETPPRQRHPGNGRSLYGDYEGPTDHPDER